MRLAGLFAEQPRVDRQPDGFSAPGRVYRQCEQDDVESPSVDGLVAGGACGVAEDAGTGDLAARLLRHRVIGGGGDLACEVKVRGHEPSKQLPEHGQAPAAAAYEPMVGVVLASALRIHHPPQARDRVSTGPGSSILPSPPSFHLQHDARKPRKPHYAAIPLSPCARNALKALDLETQGRGKKDVHHQRAISPKDVYLFPLSLTKGFRKIIKQS